MGFVGEVVARVASEITSDVYVDLGAPLLASPSCVKSLKTVNDNSPGGIVL